MGKAIGLPGGGVGYVKSHSSWAAHPGEICGQTGLLKAFAAI